MLNKRVLAVCDLTGKRIVANILRNPNNIVITIPYLKPVEKDNPKFSEKGVITVKVSKNGYLKTIGMIEKYLEDLFLKELDKNESIHSGDKEKYSGRRDNKSIDPGTKGEVQRAVSGRIHSRGRGNQQAESPGERSQDSEMAETGDTSVSEHDKDGN